MGDFCKVLVAIISLVVIATMVAVAITLGNGNGEWVAVGVCSFVIIFVNICYWGSWE